MSGNGDGLFPVLNTWIDSLYHNRCTEHGSVQDGTYGSVGTLPHFLQVVFLHAGSVGGDGGTFDCNLIFFRGVGGIDGNLVVRFVAVFQAEIIVFGF